MTVSRITTAPVGACTAGDAISDDTRLISHLDDVLHVTAETLDLVQSPLAGAQFAGDRILYDLTDDSWLMALKAEKQYGFKLKKV